LPFDFGAPEIRFCYVFFAKRKKDKTSRPPPVPFGPVVIIAELKKQSGLFAVVMGSQLRELALHEIRPSEELAVVVTYAALFGQTEIFEGFPKMGIKVPFLFPQVESFDGAAERMRQFKSLVEPETAADLWSEII
jgi:hypothetical protein